MKLFGKEPALVISTAAAVIVGAVLTLSGNGFISDALAGKVVDLTNALAQTLTLVLPFIGAGVAIRSQVTPVAKIDADPKAGEDI